MEANPDGKAVHEDTDGKVFYNSFKLDSDIYHVRDCVRINITDEEDDGIKLDFGQITAIFENPHESDPELILQLEVRWFLKPEDVRLVKSKKIKMLPNELIESRRVDDIPVGSVMGTIDIAEPSATPHSPHPSKRPRSVLYPHQNEEQTEHPCRFILSEQDDTLLTISCYSMWDRSLEYSSFAQHYGTNKGIHSHVKAETSGRAHDKTDSFSKAVAQLHISVLPTALPCREEEQKKVSAFLKSTMMERGRKVPLYISGMPGTGKTATVHAAIAALRQEQGQQVKTASTNTTTNTDPSPTFEFIEINCLRISSPQEAYTVLWRGLSGEFIGPQIALGRLKNYFEEAAARANLPSDIQRKHAQTSSKPTNYIVCLLDELDYLVTKNESIVYNFFDWPQQLNSGLIVIGIANTMDLPDRLNKRSLSRLGGQQLKRIAFNAYTHSQIYSILTDRLKHLEGVFDAKSLQFAARKAAATAGDLRSALKICQRAIELHRDHQLAISKTQPMGESKTLIPVTVQMVTRAAAEYKENPLMIATGAACNYFKGMCRYNMSTGVAEMTVEEVWDRTSEVIRDHGKCALGGELTAAPWSVFHGALSCLVKQGMLSVTAGGGSVSAGGANGGFVYNAHTMLSPRLLHSDISAALRDVKDPMAAAVWPSVGPGE